MKFDPKVFLASVGAGKTFPKYDKGKVIFEQGDAADAVFYIQKGRVKITVLSHEGKEAVVALLAVGSFFGEGCLAGQPKRTATIVTMEDCALVKIEKASIIRMLQDETAFSEVFVAHLLARSIRVEEDLIDQLFNSSEKRLARLLLLLANFGKESKPTPVIPKVNHNLLAEMIGTTRSRVSFFMNKFKRLGFIDYNGALRVNNSLLSVVLHDQKSQGSASGPKEEKVKPSREVRTRAARKPRAPATV